MTALVLAPSRDSNPFATCWTSPEAIAFTPTADANVRDCIAKLEANRWRGEIVGPHGVGKSTLLRSLAQAAEQCGRRVAWLRAGRNAQAPRSADVILLDSFETLSSWRRWQWRRRPGGLVVTAHRSVGLPTLARLRPTLADASALFEQLTDARATRVTPNDLARSFELRRGNIRDVWFDLYDLHERHTRSSSNQTQRHA